MDCRARHAARALAAGGLSLVAVARAPAQDLPAAADSAIPQLEIPEIDLFGGVTIELPGGTKPPAGAETVTFAFSDLEIRGTTVFTRADLAPIFAARVGETLTIADLYGFVNAIEERYRSEGYVLSLAYLPPQASENGVFIVEVVEGFIGDIAFEDIEDPALIEALRASFDGLLAERPVTAQSLHAALQGMNAGLGGFAVSGVLTPSATPGASDLIIRAQTRDHSASLQVDNRGSGYAGPMRATVAGSLYNVGILGDRLSASASVTRTVSEQVSGGVTYARPVDWVLPLVLQAGLSASQSEPGEGLDEQFGVKSRSLALALSAEAEILRDVDRRATLTLGFERRLVDTDFQRFNLVQARDRIGSVYVEAGYTAAGLFGGASTLNLRLEQALPFLDTKEDGAPRSRADADPGYTLLKLDAAHRQPLWGNASALLAFAGQYAVDPLYASKEFALGGQSFGRAYDSGEGIGDSGIAGAIELRYDLREPASWLTTLQPYVFLDGGLAWSSVETDPTGRIASTGLGLRAGLPYGLRLGLEYAYGLSGRGGVEYDLFGLDLGRSRLFFTLSKAF